MGGVEKGFGKITEHIFKLDIPNKQGAIAVYSYLCFRGGSNKFCFPSQATIAAAVGVSRSTVNRNLKILEEKGFIKKINKKRENNSYMSSFYILLKLVESSEELLKIEKKIEDLVSSMKQGCITHDTRVVSPVEQGCITHDTITDTINNNKEQNIYIHKKKKSKKKAVIPEWEENSNKSYTEDLQAKEKAMQQLEKLRNKNKGVKESG